MLIGKYFLAFFLLLFVLCFTLFFVSVLNGEFEANVDKNLFIVLLVIVSVGKFEMDVKKEEIKFVRDYAQK